MSKQNNLAQILQELKITPAWLEHEAGVTLITIDYLIAQTAIPKPHVAVKIARALELKVADIWPSEGNLEMHVSDTE